MILTGHYAVPGNLIENSETSETLSKTLLPSYNCTVSEMRLQA